MPRDGEPKGVLFSLHGCLQLATEWGFQSDTCPDCHGAALRLSPPYIASFLPPPGIVSRMHADQRAAALWAS